jgi:hypothetical protein
MDSGMVGKIMKASEYAREPDRVRFESFTVKFRGKHDFHTVTYDRGKWHCTCDFFTQRGVCSHTMALEKILGVMLSEEETLGSMAEEVAVAQ